MGGIQLQIPPIWTAVNLDAHLTRANIKFCANLKFYPARQEFIPRLNIRIHAYQFERVTSDFLQTRANFVISISRVAVKEVLPRSKGFR
jgi:hypothetical protein